MRSSLVRWILLALVGFSISQFTQMAPVELGYTETDDGGLPVLLTTNTLELLTLDLDISRQASFLAEDEFTVSFQYRGSTGDFMLSFRETLAGARKLWGIFNMNGDAHVSFCELVDDVVSCPESTAALTLPPHFLGQWVDVTLRVRHEGGMIRTSLRLNDKYYTADIPDVFVPTRTSVQFHFATKSMATSQSIRHLIVESPAADIANFDIFGCLSEEEFAAIYQALRPGQTVPLRNRLENGLCSTPIYCTTDAECGLCFGSCLEGLCQVPPCSSNSDCSLGFICEGTCVPGCTIDDECPPALPTCVEGQCACDTVGLHETNEDTGDVFLQGAFIQAAINAKGTFGSYASVPAGFNQPPSRTQVGFMVDLDGFGIGDPLVVGDFFLPGSPLDLFWVAYRDAPDGTITSCVADRASGTVCPATTVTDISTDELLAVQVESVLSNLKFTQVYSFPSCADTIHIDCTFENIGSGTLYDVRFTHSVDPDQDRDLSGTYSTVNTVLEDIPRGGVAAVMARGPITDFPLVLSTKDPRGVGSYGGFGTYDSYTNAFLYDAPPATGSSETSDIGIGLAVVIPEIAPGATDVFEWDILLTPDFSTFCTE